jgi:hypothetical protein
MARNDARPPSANTQITVTTVPARVDIVRAFARLPDEAFEFFTGTMLNASHVAGGFRPDSRSGIEALGLLVQRYYELKSEKPQVHEPKESA